MQRGATGRVDEQSALQELSGRGELQHLPLQRTYSRGRLVPSRSGNSHGTGRSPQVPRRSPLTRLTSPASLAEAFKSLATYATVSALFIEA